jgi:hypothetical protein
MNDPYEKWLNGQITLLERLDFMFQHGKKFDDEDYGITMDTKKEEEKMISIDPELWVSNHFDHEAKMMAKEDYIQSEMEKYKTDAVKRFHIISNPNFAEALASTIAYGYDNNLPEAVEIVNHLFLSDKHIAALNDDSKMMEQILFCELEEQEEYDQDY